MDFIKCTNDLKIKMVMGPTFPKSYLVMAASDAYSKSFFQSFFTSCRGKMPVDIFSNFIVALYLLVTLG